MRTALLLVAVVLTSACASPVLTGPTDQTASTARTRTTLDSPMPAPVPVPGPPPTIVPVPPEFDPTPITTLPPDFHPPVPPVVPPIVPSPLPATMAFVTITLDRVSCGPADNASIAIDGRPQGMIETGTLGNTWQGGVNLGAHQIAVTGTHGASYGPQTVTVGAEGLTILLRCEVKP